MLTLGFPLVQEGYKFNNNHNLLRVFSAPNYSGRCGNLGATVDFDADLEMVINVFQSTGKEYESKDRP